MYEINPEKALGITNDKEAIEGLVYATGLLCSIVGGIVLRLGDQEAINASNVADAMLTSLLLYTESNDD